MSERIKTAYERAMERAQSINVSLDELESTEFKSRGNVLAAQYLRDKRVDLMAELGTFEERVRFQAVEGVVETLLNNLSLPTDELAVENNKRVMDGISGLKEDKQAMIQILGELDYLFNYYLQAYRQAYEHNRAMYEKKAAKTQEALEHQTGVKMNVNPETQPGFKEDLMKIVAQLDNSYQGHLDEHKRRLRSLK
ncbi:MAG: hypothetical protein U1D96_05995 [Eubacteriales bacterium]|jgi:hypothetical protein|nr:hypothetical protein [Bacillota bacterium]MBV1726819.1 hypothetical protein [Desulforudis sp.]MBV1735782.1 hypothetical protein [Desulforudis sp.]MDZ4043031.1 hypothetical protein [Eubacteriales bacterium]MDZ7610372.1 hypothetical protein [Eubacteriales bacterium]